MDNEIETLVVTLLARARSPQDVALWMICELRDKIEDEDEGLVRVLQTAINAIHTL